MRLVAAHATEGPGTLRVAPRLHEPDRLEPGQFGVFGTEPAGNRLGRMTVALPAETHLRFRGPTVQAERHREFALAGPGPLHVRPGRSVALLAGDIRDQLLQVEDVLPDGRGPCGVAAKALDRLPFRQLAAMGSGYGKRILRACPGVIPNESSSA